MVRKPTETAMDTPEDTPGAADRYRAPALDKGLDILEVLALQARGLTRAEIVKEMGLGPSQIYRMLERLVARDPAALAHAIERGGTTLRDFLAPDGAPGYIEQELLAYGRGGEPCRQCGTSLRELAIGQRASVWCPRCQR